MLCVMSTALALRCAAPRACAPSGGHLFVAQGDLRRVLADAVLYPTTDAMDAEWFPDGAPGEMFERASRSAARAAPGQHTRRRAERVALVGAVPGSGAAAAGVVRRRWLPPRRSVVVRRRPASLCGRQLPLLALPVVGTGESAPIAGDMIAALIQLLRAFVATPSTCCSSPSRGRCSVAQATRRRYDRLPDGALRLWAALPPSLEAAAHRLAALARGGSLFLGSGVSRAAALPGWTELLSECARAAGVGSAAERARSRSSA